jgi:folylpolyglutamate synthase
MASLEKLSVIHVAGSKGKGSVCTYTDAILREHNIKTGLFTSPHLISVTERIKLKGLAISKQLFNDYFWEVFDALQHKKDNEYDLPSYFKFLQIMAFYIFVKENVDVAIVEVGIGGEYDSTNILRNTEIVGITSLQLEHTQLLGETLEEIAWQKSGIIKENSAVFTMPQPEICMKVINERFAEKKVNKSFKSDFFFYETCFSISLGQIVISCAAR